MAADQEADVLALDVGVDLVLALLDSDRRVESELLDDALEQHPNPLGWLLGQDRGLRFHSSFSHARSLGAHGRRRT